MKLGVFGEIMMGLDVGDWCLLCWCMAFEARPSSIAFFLVSRIDQVIMKLSREDPERKNERGVTKNGMKR